MLLIDHFGEELEFTFSRDKKKSQLFCLTAIQAENVIETIWTNDPIEVCAKQLKSECQEFDFDLDHSFRCASDLECGIEKLTSGAGLQCWDSFFDCMFPGRSSSVSIKRKCDVFFQIIFNLIHNGQRKTPFHTAFSTISQSIHDTCKSKKLIQIFNQLGLDISYGKVERIDIGITQELINLTGPNIVRVPKNINSSSIIHGAIDNFDHEGNTFSGIVESHDTILVLFQKPDMVEIQEEISKKPEDISKLSANKRSLSCILDCQTLIKRGKFCSRVEIPEDFQPELPPDMTQIIDRSKIHYETWVTSRYFSNKTNQSFPSFSAASSFSR